MRRFALTASLFAMLAAGLQANTLSFSDSTAFDSDLNPNGTISLTSFDTALGTLNSVRVDIKHSATVSISGDNDDLFKTGVAQARMIRTFDVTGPDLAASGARTINGDQQTLAIDNGDGAVFDSTGPDGFNWGMLSYSNYSAGSYFPDPSLYETVGAGNVSFIVDPTAMVNDLNWVSPPDAWQLEVENPNLTVTVKVTYDYTPVPEPMTLSLLGLGGLMIFRRRSA